MNGRQLIVAVLVALGSLGILAETPDEFVEYVESTGTQYVKTGIDAKRLRARRYVADFIPVGVGTKKECEEYALLGSFSSSQYYVQYRPINLAYGKFWMRFKGGWSSGPTWVANTRYTIDVSLTETGLATQRVSTVGQAYTQDLAGFANLHYGGELYLFACNWKGVADGFVKAKLFRLRIWDRENETADWQLVRDFRPCRSGGKGALYDVCEEKIYFPEGGDLVCPSASGPGTTEWKADGEGDWNDAANWTAGVPASTVPVLIGDAEGTKSITVSGTTPTVTKNVSVFNLGGTTAIDVASGTTLPFSGVKSLFFGLGSALTVGAGAAVTFDGTGSLTTHSRNSFPIDLEGGAWNITDGGTFTTANYMGRIKVGKGSTLSVGNGSTFTVGSTYYSAGLDVNGGTLDVSGTGRIVKTGSTTYQNVDDWTQTGFSVQNGSATFSDTSRLQMDKSSITVNGGTLRFADDSLLEFVVDAEGSSISVNAASNAVARLEFADRAKCVIRRRHQLKVNGSYFGDSTLAFTTSETYPDVAATPSVGYTKYARFQGVQIGCGKLQRGRMVVSNATVNVECSGTRIARLGRDSSSRVQAGACSEGELIVVGTGIYDSNESTYGETELGGFIVGDGTECSLTNPGRVKGRLYIGERATVRGCRSQGYFGVGLGAAEGRVVQAGGSFEHGARWQMILGAYGGEGTYVMSNGTAKISQSLVYVGGCPTNRLEGFTWQNQWNKNHDPVKLAACCPVTNHCAKGLLDVVGGAFEAKSDIIVSADGAGTLALGPNADALVLARNVILSNSADVAAGVSNVAKVKFTFGPNGTGRLVAGRRDTTTKEVVADGAVVIGAGATLDVDATDLSETNGTTWFPLVSAAQVSGDFATVNLVGARADGAVRKATRGNVSGYWFVRQKGLCILFK